MGKSTTCTKYNALAPKYPKFTNMPKHHMNLVKPVLREGVDCTGHFLVEEENSDKTIMLILVFTCLNIKFVHFELIPDISYKNFILSLPRFCNMYTIPQYFYNDNTVLLKRRYFTRKLA